MVQASSLRITNKILIDNEIYEIIEIKFHKHQKHGSQKVEFTLQANGITKSYICKCIDEIKIDS